MSKGLEVMFSNGLCGGAALLMLLPGCMANPDTVGERHGLDSEVELVKSPNLLAMRAPTPESLGLPQVQDDVLIGVTVERRRHIAAPGEDVLFRESQRLALKRRNEYHTALANKLGLSTRDSKHLVELLDERIEQELAIEILERANDDQAVREHEGQMQLIRKTRRQAIAKFLGLELNNRFSDLKESRSDWYRSSRGTGQ